MAGISSHLKQYHFISTTNLYIKPIKRQHLVNHRYSQPHYKIVGEPHNREQGNQKEKSSPFQPTMEVKKTKQDYRYWCHPLAFMRPGRSTSSEYPKTLISVRLQGCSYPEKTDHAHVLQLQNNYGSLHTIIISLKKTITFRGLKTLIQAEHSQSLTGTWQKYVHRHTHIGN